jgi:hypothetical protein
MSQSDMHALLNKIQTEFYINDGGKNTFFKNAQKQKCSEIINSQINIYDLLQTTVYIIPGTNKIYLDYPRFKQFANNTNSCEIIDYIIELLNHCTTQYGPYEMHINLKGFSVSAADRYKSHIQLFCGKCYNNRDTRFAQLLLNLYIYHTPSVIETITKLFSPFIDPEIPKKIIFLSKECSPELLDSLLSSQNNIKPISESYI